MIRFAVLVFTLFGIVRSTQVNKELVQVSIVTRNGQRTPAGPFSKDYWTTPELWPEGWMQLTPKGLEQMKTLGGHLKNRYNFFLPAQYKTKDVLVRSSNTPRTLDSASALLSSLYPNQTVPIRASPQYCDTIFHSNLNCPAFDEEMKLVSETPEVRIEEENYAPLIEWLNLRLEKKIHGLDEIEELYTNFLMEEQKGLELPDWSNAVYPEPIRAIAGKYLERSAITKLSRRLQFGPLLVDILKHASEAITNSSRSMYIYSGHDTTIAGLLKTLNGYDGYPPGFSSAILFEVHKDQSTKEGEIRFFYKNEFKTDFRKLFVPKCGYSCSLSRIQYVLDEVLPKDLKWECKNIIYLGEILDKARSQLVKKSDYSSTVAISVEIIIVLSTVIFSILLLVYSIKKSNDERRRKANQMIMNEIL